MSPKQKTSMWGERPAFFSNTLAEFSFCFSIVLSQIMSEYFISGFFVTLPTLTRDLDIPEASSTWPANAFTLTVGASLLILGRLADMYGAQRVYLVGLVWYTIWSLICGFAVNEIMLDVARAFQGFGSAAFLTSGVALLGAVYRPGRRKNIVFSIYAGVAPVGFFLGIIVGGATSQHLTWRWYFWIGTILDALALATGLFTIPWGLDLLGLEGTSPEEVRDGTPGASSIPDNQPVSDSHEEELKKPDSLRSGQWFLGNLVRYVQGSKADILGGIMIFVSLFLLNFALTDSAHAPNGWLTPYVPALFIFGSLLLIACIFYEAKLAKHPLLPLRILLLPHMGWFMFTMFLMFGSFGVWFLYCTNFIQNIIGVTPLNVVAWFVPFGLGGLVISALGGLYLDRVPGSILLMVSASVWVVANILPGVAPANASYWPWLFPTMICGTIGIDVMYIVASVFLTSSMSVEEQGLAGALFNSLQFLGISIFLAFADITAAQYKYRGLHASYQTALYLGTACAGAALVLIVLFLRLGRAEKGEHDEEVDSKQSEGFKTEV